MKVSRILLACAVLALAAACSKKDEAAKPAEAATPAAPPVVTVNGKAISQKMFELYAESLARTPFAQISAEDKDQIKENLVRTELLAQEAEKNGLTREPEVAASLEIARLELLRQATAQKLAKDQPPTETELRAEYESQLASMPRLDYRARHIVVSGEDVAQKVIDRLKGGADFAALAKQLSTQQETAKNGGELGWFPPNALGPEFAEAIMSLKKGEYTTRPVRTRMGWHVVKLEDTRESTPPPFDQVRDALARRLLTKKLTQQSDDMLKAAKVDPPLTTVPATPAAATAPAAPAPTPPAN